MAVVNKTPEKIEKPRNQRSWPTKERIKLAIAIKRVLDFLFILVAIFCFHSLVISYNSNIQYEDDNNTIKYHDFWYAVYNKDAQLKDIYFYDGINNNLDLIKFIQEKIVLQNNSDLLVRLLSKEKTWYDNFIKLPWLNGRNSSDDLRGYNIRWIFTEQNNENKFIMIYSQKKAGMTDYCFVVDTLSLSDVSAQCVSQNEPNLPVGFVHYKNFYFVSVDKEIFVYNKESKRVISIIRTDSSVKTLSANADWDIKIKMDKWDKEIKSVLIEYHIIKKNLTHNDKIIDIHINNL